MSDMLVTRNGKFTFTIGPEELSRGMRPGERMKRDNKFLLTCYGAVGKNGVLSTLDITEGTAAFITDGFPYPQVFQLFNFILICGAKSIWEVPSTAADVSSIVNVFNTYKAGGLWNVVDFYNYIYLTNGKYAIVRDPSNGVYSYSTTLPTAIAACNFNGQVIIGGTNVDSAGSDVIFV